MASEQTHRLEDMEVEEISLVTRPANNQKFLVVKGTDGNSTSMSMTTREDGSVVLKDAGDVDLSDGSVLKLSTAERDSLVGALTSHLEALTDITKRVNEAEVSDEAKGMPATLVAELARLSEQIGSTAKAVMVCPGCGFRGDPVEGGKKCPKCGAEMEEAAEEGGEEEEMSADEKLAGLLEKAKTKEGRAEIAKAMDAHAQLLKERVEAIVKIANDVAQGAATMDPKDLREKLRKLSSLGWRVEEVAEIVNVDKSVVTQRDVQLAELKGMNDALAMLGKHMPAGIEPGDRKDINGGAGSVPDGSGSEAKDFAQMFGDLPGMAEVAKRIAALEETVGKGCGTDGKKKRKKDEDEEDEDKKPVGKQRVAKTVGAATSGAVDRTAGTSPPKNGGWPFDMNRETE